MYLTCDVNSFRVDVTSQVLLCVFVVLIIYEYDVKSHVISKVYIRPEHYTRYDKSVKHGKTIHLSATHHYYLLYYC